MFRLFVTERFEGSSNTERSGFIFLALFAKHICGATLDFIVDQKPDRLSVDDACGSPAAGFINLWKKLCSWFIPIATLFMLSQLFLDSLKIDLQIFDSILVHFRFLRFNDQLK